MIYRRTGLVTGVRPAGKGLLEITVESGGREDKAYVFSGMTGPVAAGDCVLLNTTAAELNLGSGDGHFVMANLNPERTDKLNDPDEARKGHIIKLRYTPFQFKVLAVEEADSLCHEKMAQADSLAGLPVIGGSLHSMLVPCVCGIKSVNESIRVGYVMTDGGALPLAFSRAVRALREQGLICGTVTVGHAFGGDYEAVNLYSGLLAAREALQAQVIVVLMGPGVVGTATKWGHSGLEVGQVINAVCSLQGTSYTIPRLSFAEKRSRHYGLSHHTLTALADVALGPTRLVLPMLTAPEKETVLNQLRALDHRKHDLTWGWGLQGVRLAQECGLELSHMGRTYEDDPAFFRAAAAAGEAAAEAAGRTGPV